MKKYLLPCILMLLGLFCFEATAQTAQEKIDLIKNEEIKIARFVKKCKNSGYPQPELDDYLEAMLAEYQNGHFPPGVKEQLIEVFMSDYCRKQYFKKYPHAHLIYQPNFGSLAMSCEDGDFDPSYNVLTDALYKEIAIGINQCDIGAVNLPANIISSPHIEVINSGPDPFMPGLSYADVPFIRLNKVNYPDSLSEEQSAVKFVRSHVLTSTNEVVFFDFALAFYYFNFHAVDDQPYFTMRAVRLSDGQVFDEQCIVADEGDPRLEYVTSLPFGDVISTNGWDCNFFNIQGVPGDSFHLEFLISDCKTAGHFGYVYLDNIYAESCPGIITCTEPNYGNVFFTDPLVGVCHNDFPTQLICGQYYTPTDYNGNLFIADTPVLYIVNAAGVNVTQGNISIASYNPTTGEFCFEVQPSNFPNIMDDFEFEVVIDFELDGYEQTLSQSSTAYGPDVTSCPSNACVENIANCVLADKEAYYGGSGIETNIVYAARIIQWTIDLVNITTEDVVIDFLDLMPETSISGADCGFQFLSVTTIPLVVSNSLIYDPITGLGIVTLPPGTTQLIFNVRACRNALMAGEQFENCFYFGGQNDPVMYTDSTCDTVMLIVGCPGGFLNNNCVNPGETFEAAYNFHQLLGSVSTIQGSFLYDPNMVAPIGTMDQAMHIGASYVSLGVAFVPSSINTQVSGNMILVSYEISASTPFNITNGDLFTIDMIMLGTANGCADFIPVDFIVNGNSTQFTDPGSACTGITVELYSEDEPICTNSVVTAYVTPFNSSPNNAPYTYSWSNGGSGEQTVANVVGELEVQVGAGAGCSASASVEVIPCNTPCPFVEKKCDDIVKFKYIQYGCKVYFKMIDDDLAARIVCIEWDFGDGNFEYDNRTPSHQFQQSGDYKVILRVTFTDGKNKCQSIYTRGLKVNCAAKSDISQVDQSEINVNEKNEDFTFFPNPAKNDMQIHFLGEQIPTRLELLTLTGHRVRDIKFEKNKTEITVSLTGIASGVYILHAKGTVDQFKKLIIY